MVRRCPNGTPIRWPLGDIHVEISLDDAPEGVDPGDARRAAEDAFAAYAAALAPMSSGVALDVKAGKRGVSRKDDVASVTWVHEGWDDDYDPDALALTLTSYDTDTGRIEDADIVINAGSRWSTGGDCANSYDLQDVLAHEAGHLFGLGHDSGDRDATMFPSAGFCEVKKRDLAQGDLDGLKLLYVETEPPAGGCQAAPGAVGGASAWLVALALAFAVRRRRAAVLLIVVAFAAPAGATTLRKLDLDAAGKSAVIAVRGKVGSQTVRRAGARIYTDVDIVVAECLKGACGAAVTVRQLGGEIDGEGLSVEGAAQLPAGSEVVILLRARRDGTFSPVGMSQGVYQVDRETRELVRDTRGVTFAEGGEGRVERIRLEDVKRALARTRGAD